MSLNQPVACDIVRWKMRQVNASSIDGTSGTLNFTPPPDYCPICNRGTDPRTLGGVLIGNFNQGDSKLRITFQCTWRDCLESFLGYYSFGAAGSNEYHLQGVRPKNAKNHEFSELVADVSPTFVSIFNQAIAAEAQGLDEIAGIGLRKALEFLVKDFLSAQHPTKAEAIKRTALGICIEEHVADANLKATAKRATWLGNDETHYVRKWEDKDIEDLKVLIRVTVNWIDNVLLTQKYTREMNV